MKKEIHLISPRGFCAGVTRAIDVVNIALEKYGSPVYVKHEIVHNKSVIEELKLKGAVFIEDIKDVPQGAPLIFSAHGVSKLVVNEANEKKAITIDATCPLVTKVHVQAKKFSAQGYHIFLIGHRNHPEVEGTLGQIDSSEITLIENTNDVSLLKTNFAKVAFVTQTTLSVDDTKEIINQLKIKFPKIVSSAKEDICYATTNRQNAIKKYAIGCDKFIVVGSRNSSNSSRLVDVAINAGCSDAVLLDSKDELDLDLYENAKVIGISSGASVPEDLVLDIVEKFKSKYDVEIKNFELQKETVSFNLPKNIRR